MLVVADDPLEFSSSFATVRTLCRSIRTVDDACSAGRKKLSRDLVKPPAVVICERNRSRIPQPSRSSSRRTNASMSARGSAVTSAGGTRRLRLTFQNAVRGKCSRQKPRQRAMVRRSAPKSRFSSLTRRGEGPCRMAATKMTTAPRYTFRPRNRADGGVILFLQPSRSQQKLSL